MEAGRAQAKSPAGLRDRARRKHLMEGSFADAANNHGFKRARWRGLWRQQIQDWLIAVVQNLRILMRKGGKLGTGAVAAGILGLRTAWGLLLLLWLGIGGPINKLCRRFAHLKFSPSSNPCVAGYSLVLSNTPL